MGNSHKLCYAATMKIRTVDDKNRVTITTAGSRLYAESVDDKGVITLSPIHIPRPPNLGSDAPRAIYVGQFPMMKTGTITITLNVPIAALGYDAMAVADHIAALADRYESPIAVNAMGFGGPLADALREKTGQQVIEVLPGKID